MTAISDAGRTAMQTAMDAATARVGRRVAWRFADDVPRPRPLVQIVGPAAPSDCPRGVYIGTVAEIGDYARHLVARHQARP